MTLPLGMETVAAEHAWRFLANDEGATRWWWSTTEHA